MEPGSALPVNGKEQPNKKVDTVISSCSVKVRQGKSVNQGTAGNEWARWNQASTNGGEHDQRTPG